MITPLGVPAVDTTPPVLSNGMPTGTLPAGTAQTSLGVTTNEAATCRYATTAATPFASMPNTFASTGGTTHSTLVTGLANGTTYTYYVRCRDGSGNANTADFLITFSVANQSIDTTPPVLSSGMPTGTLPAGTAQASLGVTTNEAATCRYATTAATPFASMPNTFASTGGTTHSTLVTGLANGTTYTYYVRCRDGSGNANTADFLITFSVANQSIDTTPPAVNLTAPATGATVTGSAIVSANATDNIGVVGVQFLLDGAPLGTEDTTAPFSIGWNATKVPNGAHLLQARARDAANNQTTSAAVSVTVDNTNLKLVAAYAFNEGSGVTAGDLSGNNLSGAINGATWTAGKFGGALSFNGVSNLVTVADANALDLTTALTLEAWVYPTVAGGGSTWRNVLIKERPGGEVYNLYASVDTDRPSVYVVRAAQTGTPLDATGTAGLPVNTWTHLAATYNGTTLLLYVNGIQVGSRAVSGALLTSTGALRIGGNSVWGEFFQGRIDEVRIYNRALTAAQLLADMNTPVAYNAMMLSGSSVAVNKVVAGSATGPVSPPPSSPVPSGGGSAGSPTPPSGSGSGGGAAVKPALVAAYGFEESSGAQVIDASGHGNHGTISGATRVATTQFGNVLRFNGSNNWVTVNHSASLDFTSGMTVEAWVYPTASMSGWNTVVLKEQPGDLAYSLYANSSANRPSTAVNVGGTDRDLSVGPYLPANEWTHLAATYDGSTQQLYVNGAPVGKRSQTGAITLSNGALRIGGNSVWGEYFTGYIDEVRIYNQALSQAEIASDSKTAVVGLVVSKSSNRSNSVPLNGAPVSGNIYVSYTLISPTATTKPAKRVKFWLDDPNPNSPTSSPRRIDDSSPFDFAGAALVTALQMPSAPAD